MQWPTLPQFSDRKRVITRDWKRAQCVRSLAAQACRLAFESQTTWYTLNHYRTHASNPSPWSRGRSREIAEPFWQPTQLQFLWGMKQRAGHLKSSSDLWLLHVHRHARTSTSPPANANTQELYIFKKPSPDSVLWLCSSRSINQKNAFTYNTIDSLLFYHSNTELINHLNLMYATAVLFYAAWLMLPYS